MHVGLPLGTIRRLSFRRRQQAHLRQSALTHPTQPTAARHMIQRAQTFRDLLSRTMAADRLDEQLWALVVTRAFGKPEAVRAWLRNDESRLLGGLDASLSLATTILPSWRIRLHSRAGLRPQTCCDRRGYPLGFVDGADPSLAKCAARLRALLAAFQQASSRGQLMSRDQLWRVINPAGFMNAGDVAAWARSAVARSFSRAGT